MPRNVTVTFDDGTTHVYQGVPDSATPEQVQQRAAKDFGGKVVKGLDGGRKEAAPAAPEQIEKPSLLNELKQQTGNLAAGALRGAGSIGATILWPVDKIGDMIDRANGVSNKGLKTLITGEEPLTRNQQRRRAMTEALGEMGAEPDSVAFGVGKLGAEIAGTAGAGAATAATLGRTGLVAPSLLTSIQTGGMSAGQAQGIANPLIRAAGGAINGAVSAGMVNPEDTIKGAAVGAALPGMLQIAGKGANALGRLVRGPEQAADVAQAVQAARSAGYVIPPTQARPSLPNRLLEGFSGKITTAQNASAKNQVITNEKVASALGLPGDTKITPDVLDTVRKQAGQAYDAVAQSGVIKPSQAYDTALDNIIAPFKKAAAGFPNAKANPIINEIDSLRSPEFDAGSAVEKIKELRDAADAAYRAGDKGVGKAYKSAAGALEDAIDTHLQSIGAPSSVLDGFRESRKLIAKTYTVENALNSATGTVDARKLASQLQKGKPLSGELKDVAEFAARFPKAAQTVEQMGSLPQTSPLDWGLGATMSAATANPLMLASAMARPGARKLALSPVVQDRLIQPNAFQSLAAPQGLRRIGYQAAPLLATDQ